MKVLVIAEQQSGLPHTWLGLWLARAGVEVRFVFQHGSPATGFLRQQGLAVQELPLRGRLDFKSLRALRAVLRAFQPDIIHAFTAKTCWLAIWAQWPRKESWVVFYRGATRRPSWWSPNDWLLFLSEQVDAYECNCQGVADYLLQGGVPAHKIVVNHYGHQMEWYAANEVPPPWRRKSAPFRIGSVRNYRKSKGLETLVDAADILAERGVDFELLVVGDDKQGMLAQYVARARSRQRIKLAGPFEHPWGLLRTFDCAVVPSLREGLGKAALEALACGVPLVASAVEGLLEIVEPEVNGLLVPPGDPVKLADAIER